MFFEYQNLDLHELMYIKHIFVLECLKTYIFDEVAISISNTLVSNTVYEI